MLKQILPSILPAIIRSAFTYIYALFLTRVMGRKLISQMTFFDFIVGVTVGSLAANMMLNTRNTSYIAFTALFTVAILTVLTGYVNKKSFKARKAINSEPVTIMDKGIIVEKNMKRVRLTLGELTMRLREKNIFNLADVEFAIMETDGQLSVLPKADKAPLTPSHMNIQAASSGLMRDIIIDGVLMEENLSASGTDFNWVQSELNKQGVKDITEVFYAGLDSNKKLYLSKRNAGNTREANGKYGIDS